MSSQRNWDIFCAVVDNYGDIGVCWRLARQLAEEHGRTVRLWVDRLAPFRRLCPEIDPQLPRQTIRGVEIRHWADRFPAAEAADVVIEAFACALPERYVAAMAAREIRPVWINLEYLSAEEWVPGCHGLASPHPRLPLVKHFFFPGFVPGSGGLLCERGLLARRRAFRGDAEAPVAFWRSLGLAPPSPGEVRVSLFCYPNRAVGELFLAWERAPAPTLCLVPEGVADEAVGAFFGLTSLCAGDTLNRGNLKVRILPFLAQDDYDKLLWACDCNFVRGEDSFIRAQWAARPLVWHIYPQEDGAHRAKLEAFLKLYCAGLAETAAESVRAMWGAWNRQAGAGMAWEGFWRNRTLLSGHAERWCAGLLENGDLATNLVTFCADKL